MIFEVQFTITLYSRRLKLPTKFTFTDYILFPTTTILYACMFHLLHDKVDSHESAACLAAQTLYILECRKYCVNSKFK